jgi:hypothetical protein
MQNGNETGTLTRPNVHPGQKIGHSLSAVTQAVDIEAVKALQKDIAENYWGTKSLAPVDAYRMAKVAVAYGLDPFLGHLEILGGKPYVTVAGQIFKAQGTGRLEGIDFVPLSSEEREQYKVKDNEIATKAVVYLVNSVRPYIGYGYASEADVQLQGKKMKDIRYMAENRAVGRALRRAFPIGLSTFEELDDFDRSELAENVSSYSGNAQPKQETVIPGTAKADKEQAPPEPKKEPPANSGVQNGTHQVPEGQDTMVLIRALEPQLKGWFPAKTDAMLKSNTPVQVLARMQQELTEQQNRGHN